MSGTLFTHNPDGVCDLRLGLESTGDKLPRTVCDVFKSTVFKHNAQPALSYKASGADGPWTTLTWADYYAQSVLFAKTLLSLGFAPHRCTNIIGFNSHEWFIANVSSLASSLYYHARCTLN